MRRRQEGDGGIEGNVDGGKAASRNSARTRATRAAGASSGSCSGVPDTSGEKRSFVCLLELSTCTLSNSRKLHQQMELARLLRHLQQDSVQTV